MQAVVKTPHTKIEINGEIHPKLLDIMKDLYGKNLKIKKEKEDPYLNILDTEWYKIMNGKMTPGKYLRVYRERDRMSQWELGKILGGISRQNISHIENGRRGISKNMAKKLSEVFEVSIDYFI
jgi:DNA-binding XRE family transcriptional regulator